jgi:hypothetical protein
LDQRFAEQDAKWERRFAELRADRAHMETRLIRWMVGLWITSFGAMLARSSCGWARAAPIARLRELSELRHLLGAVFADHKAASVGSLAWHPRR